MKNQKLAGHSGILLKSNILEAETKELLVPGQAGLHSEFQASLGYMKLYLQTITATAKKPEH